MVHAVAAGKDVFTVVAKPVVVRSKQARIDEIMDANWERHQMLEAMGEVDPFWAAAKSDIKAILAE